MVWQRHTLQSKKSAPVTPTGAGSYGSILIGALLLVLVFCFQAYTRYDRLINYAPKTTEAYLHIADNPDDTLNFISPAQQDAFASMLGITPTDLHTVLLGAKSASIALADGAAILLLDYRYVVVPYVKIAAYNQAHAVLESNQHVQILSDDIYAVSSLPVEYGGSSNNQFIAPIIPSDVWGWGDFSALTKRIFAKYDLPNAVPESKKIEFSGLLRGNSATLTVYMGAERGVLQMYTTSTTHPFFLHIPSVPVATFADLYSSDLSNSNEDLALTYARSMNSRLRVELKDDQRDGLRLVSEILGAIAPEQRNVVLADATHVIELVKNPAGIADQLRGLDIASSTQFADSVYVRRINKSTLDLANTSTIDLDIDNHLQQTRIICGSTAITVLYGGWFNEKSQTSDNGILICLNLAE